MSIAKAHKIQKGEAVSLMDTPLRSILYSQLLTVAVSNFIYGQLCGKVSTAVNTFIREYSRPLMSLVQKTEACGNYFQTARLQLLIIGTGWQGSFISAFLIAVWVQCSWSRGLSPTCRARTHSLLASSRGQRFRFIFQFSASHHTFHIPRSLQELLQVQDEVHTYMAAVII